MLNARFSFPISIIASLLPNADNFFTLMKNTIDDIIRNDKKLISIIQWAQEKAGNDYLTLGPYGRGVALDLTLNHDHYYDYKQNYDLLLDRTLTLLLDFALEREYTLRLTNVCNRACDYAKDLNLTHLLRDLKTLTIPNQDSGETSWQKFISDLRLIMITYRNIGHDWWILTKKQQIQIEQYQEATYLLLNCLNLAYVSDRVRIENSLWLLPREKP